MSTTETGGSFVKVNRLKDSWTWNVSVMANDNSVDEVREAKEKALVIARELGDELNPVVEDERDEEIRF